jgi:hypothetical protein
MTEVIIYDADNTVWKLDVTADVSIPLQFGIADVREPQNAKGTWSKTATFKGTANNNKAFKHVYEISGDSLFNVNKKVRCVIIQDGVNDFVGYVRLLNIKRKNNGSNDYNRIQYELSFFGETADLFKNITGDYLHDLDFSEWDHDYTFSNVTNSAIGNTVLNGVAGQNSITLGSTLTINSFAYNSGYLQVVFASAHSLAVDDEVYIVKTSNATNSHYNGFFFVKSVENSTTVTLWMVYGENTGIETGTGRKITRLGVGYVFPMIDYGLNTGSSWDIEHTFPAIYVKNYIDKIFENAGYTYSSTFFDSQYFKSLIIPFNKDTFAISQAEVLEREFKATYSANATTVTDSSTGIFYNFNFGEPIEPDNDSTNGNSDDNGNYYVPTGEYTAPVTGYYNFNWNVIKLVTLDAIPVGYTRIIDTDFITIGGRVNGINTFSQAYFQSFLNTSPLQGTSPSIFLNAGDVVDFRLTGVLKYRLKDASNNYYTTSQDVDLQILQGTFLQCRMLNTVIGEGATIELNNAIPKDILQSDFLSSIIKTFKLFIEPDGDNSKKLVIEPRDSFYSNSVLDWTSKVDISRDIDITPMGELNSKRYTLKYKSDKDAFNQNHEQYYARVYGTKIVDIDNDFVSGETIIEPIFSASPLVDYPVGTDRVITSIVKEGVITQNRIASNIRLLFYSLRGTKFPYTITYGTSSSATVYTYAYAGHLDNVWMPIHDLNFGYPDATYYNYGAWTNNNLYNRFHARYIDEITDKNSKLVKAYLHIKPMDILNLDFAKLIRIDKHLLRLNKIMDYDINSTGLTLCEFILAKDFAGVTKLTQQIAYGVDATLGGDLIPRPLRNGFGLGGSENPTRQMDGVNNFYGGNNTGIKVSGNNNVIGFGARNITINGDNNSVNGDFENVVIFGNDTTVTRSNTTYMNGVAIDGEGSIEYVNANFKAGIGTGNLILVDASGSNITITLDLCADVIGIPITIKKIDSSVNTVTVNPANVETIDSVLTYTIRVQYDICTIVSDGVNWNLI